MMARSADQVHAEVLAILPDGWALADHDPDSYVGGHFRGLSNELSLVEASGEAMLPQVDPGAATDLLPDYEGVLGPDPCGRDQLSLATADRQSLAWQRWTQGGDICAGWFEAQAAQLGVAMTITEYTVSMCGLSVCGVASLVNGGAEFGFLVSLPATRVKLAISGSAQCGDLLGSFTSNLMQCVVQTFAPLHTKPAFTYN